jgi:hypothetical protein
MSLASQVNGQRVEGLPAHSLQCSSRNRSYGSPKKSQSRASPTSLSQSRASRTDTHNRRPRTSRDARHGSASFAELIAQPCGCSRNQAAGVRFEPSNEHSPAVVAPMCEPPYVGAAAARSSQRHPYRWGFVNRHPRAAPITCAVGACTSGRQAGVARGCSPTGAWRGHRKRVAPHPHAAG